MTATNKGRCGGQSRPRLPHSGARQLYQRHCLRNLSNFDEGHSLHRIHGVLIRLLVKKTFGDCREYKTALLIGRVEFVPNFFTLDPFTLLKKFKS